MAASKKKVALVFGYNGTEFFGSQIQSGAVRTVESELEAGLFKAGMVSEANHGSLHKIGWSRASRTDRGVHARTTTIGLKLEWPGGPSSSIPSQINPHLPSDLRVFSVKEVTNSFNAHGKANYREYEYLFPARLVLKAGEVYTLEVCERIRQLTSKFIGTKNYHNFTRKLSFDKAESKRYIVKFEPSGELVTCGDCAFIRFLITGQSFLYHQIRSMVGSVLAVLLEKWTPADIDTSFLEAKRMVPIAPAEGLFLSQVLYTTYNRKQPQKAVSLTTDEETNVEEFFKTAILPSVAGAIRVFEEWRPEDDGEQSQGEQEIADMEG